MTKAEKNYKRDYGHKDSAELALNYTCDGMREELDKALSEVSPNDLTADEQEYLDGRNQCRNHTLNIRFNDTEWEHICRQAELLRMKKSSYVRECAKAHYVLMMDQGDMNGIIDMIYNLRVGDIHAAVFSDEFNKLCIPFEDSLSAEQIEVFHKILDCVSDTTAAEMRAAYKVGFKDGVSLMKKIWNEYINAIL